MFIQNWHDTCLYAIFQWQINWKQSQCDTGWSRSSRTPSATSSSSSILMNITGTCCTRLGWACRGRWGCPRALRSPWNPSRSFSFQISFMNMFQMFNFMNINGTCCTPHGWACRGRWGCPWWSRGSVSKNRGRYLYKKYPQEISWS